jgi:hypothetical protein
VKWVYPILSPDSLESSKPQNADGHAGGDIEPVKALTNLAHNPIAMQNDLLKVDFVIQQMKRPSNAHARALALNNFFHNTLSLFQDAHD